MSKPNSQQLPSRSTRHTGAGKGRKPRRLLYGIAGLLLLVLSIAAFYLAYNYYKINKVIPEIFTEEEVAPEDSAKVKPLSILLLGLDSRPQTGSLNTDVIMGVALNPETKSATVVSIPRDTYTKSIFGFRSNKANAFYANLYVEDSKTANKRIKEVFGRELGVDFDYVALVNFKGFSDAVDALGGIKVDVDMDMKYVDRFDGTNIDLKAGLQTLNGKQALDFVRYRKSNNGETAESSDLERNVRQQLVVAKVLEKLKSFGGVMKMPELIEVVGNNLATDIPSQQVLDLVRTYMGIEKDNINYIHLEGEWKSPYVYIPEADWQHARDALQAALKLEVSP